MRVGVTRLYGATGLGLSISESLCLLMNSSLHVTSTVGQGSTFAFEVNLGFVPCTPLPEPPPRQTVAVLPAPNVPLPDSIRIGTIAQLVSSRCCVVPSQEAHLADLQLVVHANDWPMLNDKVPAIPTVFPCSTSAPPPIAHHAHIAFVSRPFKQSHLFRIFDSLPAVTSGAMAALPADPSKEPPTGVTRHDSKISHDATAGLTPPPPPLESSAATSPPTVALATAKTQTPSLPPSFRVLVVDDNPLNRRLLVATLTRLGHATEQACDGKEAVDRVLHDDKPQLDCVFMDFRMPLMDGLEATRRIVHHYSTHDSKQRRRPIIIGLSADAMTEQEDEGLLNGMDKYLRKPVLKKDLVSALHEFVAERSIPSSNDLN